MLLPAIAEMESFSVWTWKNFFIRRLSLSLVRNMSLPLKNDPGQTQEEKKPEQVCLFVFGFSEGIYFYIFIFIFILHLCRTSCALL